MDTRKRPVVALGEVVITANARLSLPWSEILGALSRHSLADWGDLGDDDRRANDAALSGGGRLLSAYTTSGGVRFWVITEADRSSTCVLLPEDY